MCKKGESIYKQLNDRGWLEKKYLVEKEIPRKIAEEIGCVTSSVLNAFKRYDIPTRGRSEANKGKNIFEKLYEEGWLYQKYKRESLSPGMIAKMLGCSSESVYHALKRQNIRISERPKGRKSPLFGRHLSRETKRKISDARIGQKHSRKAREKMSAARTKLTPIQRKMNSAMRGAMGKALRGAKAGRSWESIAGYSLMDLMRTLEKEFVDGMCWDNYGVWEIDHIIPLAKFDYNSYKNPDFKKAWALNNLQPLWKYDNIKKRDNFMFF